MKRMLKFSGQYIKFYKKKSAYILASVILSVVMITIVCILQNSGNKAEIEYVRKQAGDFHYIFNMKSNQYNALLKETDKYNMVKVSHTQHLDDIKKPYVMEAIAADYDFLEMVSTSMLQGKLPENETEVALEEWTLRNLSFDAQIGERIILEGKEYTLSGIINDRQIVKDTGLKQAFLAVDNKVRESNELRVYIKFDESTNIEDECRRFAQDYGIVKKGEKLRGQFSENRDLMQKLGVDSSTAHVASFSIEGILANSDFDSKILVTIISLFATFIISSIFQVSVIQRITEYGIMKAVGANNNQLFCMVFSELLIILCIGYPIGVLGGIGITKVLYGRLSNIFLEPGVSPGKLYISYTSLWLYFLFFVVLMLVVSVRVIRKISKVTILAALQKRVQNKERFLNNHKIYGKSKKNLMSVLMWKYMFQRRMAFIGIVLSLSIGGIILVLTDYVIAQTKINNELTLKADDGMNSDFQITIEDMVFEPGVPEAVLEKLKNTNGVTDVHPIHYYLGGIKLKKSQLLWEDYFDGPEQNGPNYKPDIKEKFGGVWTQEENDDYLLKTNIYGYDDKMLTEMGSFLLEGAIDTKLMNTQNLVLVEAPLDGVGSYEGLDIKPGDVIQVKYQKSSEISEALLKFPNTKEYEEEFITKEFVVAGLVKRVMAQNEYFIADNGLSLVISNKQFESLFMIEDYNMVSVQKQSSVTGNKIIKEIQNAIKEVPACIVRDFTVEIERRQHYLNQKLYFLYGITLILFFVGLINMYNNISYQISSKQHEYAVVRAMGISDKKLLLLLIRQGVFYGLVASVFMLAVAYGVQHIIEYTLKHVYLYINVSSTLDYGLCLVITLLNIIMSLVAVMMSARNIVHANIIEGIKSSE